MALNRAEMVLSGGAKMTNETVEIPPEVSKELTDHRDAVRLIVAEIGKVEGQRAVDDELIGRGEWIKKSRRRGKAG